MASVKLVSAADSTVTNIWLSVFSPLPRVGQACNRLWELWPTNQPCLMCGLGKLKRNGTTPHTVLHMEKPVLHKHWPALSCRPAPYHDPMCQHGVVTGNDIWMSNTQKIPRIWETAHNCPNTTGKGEWKITIDHMKKRQLKILKALSDFYNLFTETLKTKRVTFFSQPSENARNYKLRLFQHLWHTCPCCQGQWYPGVH